MTSRIPYDTCPLCGSRRFSAGIEGHCIDITKFDPNGRYAVISMADVLEHMPYPRAGLDAAHRLLRPDGILFLSMPNAGPLWRA